MRGDGHNAAGTVISQNKVCGVDGHFPAGQRIEAIGIQKQAFFFIILGGPHQFVLFFNFFHKLPDIAFAGLPFGQLHDQRMLGGHQHKGCAEERVLAGGENFNGAFAFCHGEIHFAAVTFADPVFLHRHDAFRPAGQLVAIFQKLFDVGGDFKEPLIQNFFLHFGTTAPAQAAFDLLIGQHCIALGAEVDAGAFFVCQAFFIHPDKEELFPAVIFRLTGGDLPIPVVAESHAFELFAHVVDIFIGPFGRMDFVFDGGVFRGHTEGVPANRMQDVKSFHALVAGDHVPDGIITNMADMDFAGRVGKHLQQVVFFLLWVFGNLKDFFFIPFFLPFFFDGNWIVLHKYGVLPECK